MIKYLLTFIIIFIFSGEVKSTESNGYIVKFKNNKSLSLSCENKDCLKIKKFNMAFTKQIPKENSNILYIQPNYIYHTLGTPSDSLYSKQWGMKKIQAEAAWDVASGSKDLIVAVIDTGIDYNHPDLKNNIWTNEKELSGKSGVDDDGNGLVDDVHGYDYSNKDGDPMDGHGHGTHCAGVIGASHNDIGVAGINKNIKLMAIKFLSDSGSGETKDAILAIAYAVDNGAKVLSNSWGGGGEEKALLEAITYAKDKGVLFIAAAGNDASNNDRKPSYPASYKVDNVISVAATDIDDKKASFSNYGASVHVAAPGVNVTSTVKGGGYQAMSGTSMACPHVAGSAALMMSFDPTLTYKEVKERIIATSDYLPGLEDLTFNAGRLNLINMLNNNVPVRPSPPNEEKWKSVQTKISSVHPYLASKTYEYSIDVPTGYNLMRLHFNKFETEESYDKVTFGSKEYSGSLGEFFSKSFKVKGMSSLKIKLTTDSSVNGYGFDVDYIQVQ